MKTLSRTKPFIHSLAFLHFLPGVVALCGLLLVSGCDECDGPECCESDTDVDGGTEDPVDMDPVRIVSLDELMDSLNGGESVRAVFYYGDCMLEGSPGPDATGGMQVSTYEWFAQGVVGNTQEYVVFSKSSLIQIYDDYVYDYVKARVYADGTVTLLAEYLDPITFDVSMHEEFDCELNQNDEDELGVSLFTQTP